RFELSANQYPGVVHPKGYTYLQRFRLDPFPIFTYAAGGFELEKSVLLVRGENTVVVVYSLRRDTEAVAGETVCLEVRPLIAFRDFHATTHENPALDPSVQIADGVATVAPYASLPALHVAHDAVAIEPHGEWYRSFEYEAERARGLDFREDLFHPFMLRFD